MTKVPWVDFGTAFLSAFGTLAALMERGKTGRGQKVEGALLRTAIAIANAMLIEQAMTGIDRVATVNRGFNNAPGDVYRCRDGWIVTTVIGPLYVRAMVRDGRRAGWTADPRFQDDQARADNGRDDHRQDDRMVRRQDLRGGAGRARKGQHRRRPDLFAAAGARRAAYPRRRAPRRARIPRPAARLPLAPTPIELSETPGSYRRRAPLIGEHTDRILASLGYSAAEIAALREEKVV